MKLPATLGFLRETRLWQSLRDWRYVRRHRARRDFYRQFVHPGTLVFDVGANVGHYTLLFESLGARVLAVEPQASLVAGLRRRFAGRPRVQVLQTALGPASSTAVLHKAPGLTEIASLRADVAVHSRFASTHVFSEAETVPVTTLDALIAEDGLPDFCKIDVEGFESAVLAGLSRPIRALSFEFNREFWSDTTLCLGQLRQLGTYHFNFALGEETSLGSPEWLNAETLTSVLAGQSDPLLWGDIYAKLA